MLFAVVESCRTRARALEKVSFVMKIFLEMKKFTSATNDKKSNSSKNGAKLKLEH